MKLQTKEQVKSAIEIENERLIRRGIMIAKKVDELEAKYRQKSKELDDMTTEKTEMMNGKILELQEEITELENRKEILIKS